ERTLAAFQDLLARFEPFDLVIDEATADGREARVSRTSVCGSWGAIAGPLRYFADRFGNPRAGIEGTQIPERLIRRYARRSPPTVEFAESRHRGRLVVVRTVDYFGFQLERESEPLPSPFPDALAAGARNALATALLEGRVPHPDQRTIRRALERCDEYWRRSGGTIPEVSPERLSGSIAERLEGVDSWEAFVGRSLVLDPDLVVTLDVRRRLDALPSSVHLYGDRAPLQYEIDQGSGVVRMLLKEGQARRLRPADLPQVDRPLRFAVLRGRRPEMLSSSLEEMRRQLSELPRTERAKLVRRGRRPRRR
ncbi:MAG TPA: DEAD/DEAH box helicase, partial [Thermoplasmata archaeon]